MTLEINLSHFTFKVGSGYVLALKSEAKFLVMRKKFSHIPALCLVVLASKFCFFYGLLILCCLLLK